jgi:hypothetical protein
MWQGMQEKIHFRKIEAPAQEMPLVRTSKRPTYYFIKSRILLNLKLYCNRCLQVMYCSAACLAEAAEKYHFTECPVLRQLFAVYQWNDVNDGSALTVRILSIIGIDKWREFLATEASTCTTSGIKGFNTEGQYISSSLIALYNLASNIPETDGKEVLMCCLTTILIMKCLGLDNDPNYNEFAGSVLQLHMSTYCNWNGYILPFFKGCSLQPETVDVGRSLALGFSLLNHSCNPNAAYFFSENYIIVKALEPIKMGEQVTISYQHVFISTPKIDRINHLQGIYSFTCECEACIHSWPLFECLPPEHDLHLELMQQLQVKAFKKMQVNDSESTKKLFLDQSDLYTRMDFLSRLYKQGKTLNQVYMRLKYDINVFYYFTGTFYHIDH